MKNINVNELLTYSDFEKYKNKVVYAVSYSEFISGGVLIFVDNLTSNENFNPENLFDGAPTPCEFNLLCTVTYMEELDTCMHVYDIMPVSGSWNNVDNNIKPSSWGKTTPNPKQNVFGFSTRLSNGNIINEYNFKENKNIHIFPTKDDCQNYIEKCNKVMLKNMMKCCETKAIQYKRTAEKLSAFFSQNFE